MSDAPSAQAVLAPDSALPEIRHKGRVWKVGRPDQDARARLEKLVKKVALEQVYSLKGVLDPEAYREAFQGLLATLAEFSTWGAGWQAIVFRQPHLFLWSLLQAHHPEVTEAEVKALAADCADEVEYAVAQVVPDFLALLLSDLVARAPAAKRAGVEAESRRALDQFRTLLAPTTSAAASS